MFVYMFRSLFFRKSFAPLCRVCLNISVGLCLELSSYFPLIKTTVSFTDRDVYKWQVLRKLQTCPKGITPNQCHFNNLILFVFWITIYNHFASKTQTGGKWLYIIIHKTNKKRLLK
jgi:hypothetical protein